jgi:D-sedoheptulose 7-phosphate isomerase
MVVNRDIVLKHIEDSIEVKKKLASTSLDTIVQVASEIILAYRRGNKVVWFGNGGSAADAQHLSAELVGKFYRTRRALDSIALTTNTSILTAVANDFDFNEVFDRQVEAIVKQGDVVIGISTSGKSPNVITAMKRANNLGAITVALTGANAEKMRADYVIAVPSTYTPRIQESHIMIGHILCYLVEEGLFGESQNSKEEKDESK